jgi:hypothetical protein
MPTITKSGSKITIGAMKHEGKSIIKKIFDLKGHEGERVRVHIDNDGKYTVESRPTQKLLICELDIPEKVLVHTKTTKKDENGEFIIKTEEKTLDLSKVEMKEYLDLEEEVKKIIK